jgi:hypothetical protein
MIRTGFEPGNPKPCHRCEAATTIRANDRPTCHPCLLAMDEESRAGVVTGTAASAGAMRGRAVDAPRTKKRGRA